MPANMFMRIAFPNVAQVQDQAEATDIISQAYNSPGGVQTLLNTQSQNPIINQFRMGLIQQQQQNQANQNWRDYYNESLATNVLANQPDLAQTNPTLMNLYSMGAQSPEMYKTVLPQIEKLSEGFTLSPGQKRFTSTGKEIASGGLNPEQQNQLVQQASSMRGQYIGVTKNFSDQNDAYGRIMASVNNPSPAGDMALIYNYMKILDPASVVRESEFEMAAKTGSLGTQFQNWVDRALSGKFSDALRKDIVDRSTKLFKQAADQNKLTMQEFSGMAQRANLNPADVAFQRQTIQPQTSQMTTPQQQTLKIDQRGDQIKAQNPNMSDQQILQQLLREGYK